MPDSRTPEHAEEFLAVLDTVAMNIRRVGSAARTASSLISSNLPMSQRLKAARNVEEIMRMSVVFIHATLEDGLREMMRVAFKHNPDMPIPEGLHFQGTTSSQLTVEGLRRQFQGKDVDEIVQESVNSYLDSISFSSVNKIEGHLAAIDIQLPSEVKRRHFRALEELCQRRHQVVHRADLILVDGKRQAAPITPSDIMNWMGMTVSFMFEVLRLTLPERFRTAGLDASIDKQIERAWENYQLTGDDEE